MLSIGELVIDQDSNQIKVIVKGGAVGVGDYVKVSYYESHKIVGLKILSNTKPILMLGNGKEISTTSVEAI